MNQALTKRAHFLFLVGLFIKGLNGVAEVAMGIGMWIATPAFLHELLSSFVREELYEDPADFFMNLFVRVGDSLTTHDIRYISFFLFVHGTIKLTLSVLLLKRWVQAYPIAIAVFAGFILYQFIHFLHLGSYVDLGLCLVDAVIVYLTVLEYKRLKTKVS